FGHAGGLTGGMEGGLTGRAPPKPPPPANPAVTPMAHAAPTPAIAAAVKALRIPRSRARLRRTRMSGMGRDVTGCTHAASCSRSGSSSMGHLLVGPPKLAVQPVPGRRQPGPDRAHRDPAVACDVVNRE